MTTDVLFGDADDANLIEQKALDAIEYIVSYSGCMAFVLSPSEYEILNKLASDSEKTEGEWIAEALNAKAATQNAAETGQETPQDDSGTIESL